jgi:NAD(P)-dependent dehydrogenase (short-subunit alcohol dehydrogenase family)
MTIEQTVMLVTGANRGIGAASVEEALARGAKHVCAGTCQPVAHPDERVAVNFVDTHAVTQASKAAFVARAILDGAEEGEEDIVPDPMSQSMTESWLGGATKAMERQNALLVATDQAAS